MSQSPRKKRGRQLEYDSIAKIETADVGCRATVHGIVASLSLVKSGPAKKYYRGVLADNDKSIPFIAFSPRNAEPPGHDLLQAFREKGDPVIIGNCEVKTNNFTGIPKAELQVHSTTVFEKSLKSFDETVVLEESEESEQLSMKHITLSQLIEQYVEPVIVRVKAIRVEPSRSTQNDSVVQKVKIADSTGVCNVDLWSQFVGQLKKDQCYELSGVRKKTYSDKHSLFTPKKNAVIVPITENFGIVAPVHDHDDETTHEKVLDVRVISVSNFSAEKKCPMCKKGNVKLLPEQPAAARCSSCRTISRLLSCTAVTTCELNLQTANCVPLFCTAYEDVLSQIAQLPLKDVDEVKLLLAEPFNAFLNHGSITRVERPKPASVPSSSD